MLMGKTIVCVATLIQVMKVISYECIFKCTHIMSVVIRMCCYINANNESNVI